ncbi:MAG: peptidoglycan-binding domain-containing protein [Thainema sp.]
MQTNINIQRPTVQRGSQGAVIKDLQHLLNQRGPIQLQVDGIFGPQTEFAVKVMQYRLFLAEDGIVGPKTWKSLDAGYPVDMPVLRSGSRNEHVERLQRVFSGFDNLIYPLYHAGPIDGIFGPKTEAAVKVFQGEYRLVVDGIVGPQTWMALYTLSSQVSHATL